MKKNLHQLLNQYLFIYFCEVIKRPENHSYTIHKHIV